MSFYNYLYSYLKTPSIIIIVISILFLISFFILIYRIYYFYATKTNLNDFLYGIFNNLKRKNIFESINLCDEMEKYPIAKMAKVAILSAKEDLEFIKFTLDGVALRERESLEKGIIFINTMIYVIPLLGLLGTFVSIIQTFFAIGSSKSIITLSSLANYIGDALVSTTISLLASIILLIGYNFIAVSLKKIIDDISIGQQSIVDFFSKNKISIEKVEKFLENYEKV